MDNGIRQALESIRLDWADTPDDVWGTSGAYHVAGLHEQVTDETMRSFVDAQRSESASPIGVVIRGAAGSGKTHLLGQIRQRVQERGGYFFLVKLLDGSDFWKSVTVAILESLSRPSPGHPTQLAQLLDHLAQEAGVTESTRAGVVGEASLTASALEEFVEGVYRHHPHRRRSQHILRALVLTASRDYDARDLGEAFLHLDVDDADELAQWGIRNATLGYQEMVQNISRIVAFDAAAVLAIDQIDTLIEAGRSTAADENSVVNQVAHGLMALRENMSRTTTVVSSITAAWEHLESRVMRSAVERFRTPPMLQRPPSADFARELLSKRFAPGFAEVGFTPPRPYWPVDDTALADAQRYTPREIMMAVDRHIADLLRGDTFTPITALAPPDASARVNRETTKERESESSVAGGASSTTPDLAMIEKRYRELIELADPAGALDYTTEDAVVPDLLAAGLGAWIEALPPEAGEWHHDPRPGAKAVLHGRIRHVIDPAREFDESWSFRALAATHPRSVQSRLTNANNAAGLSLGEVERTLVVLRRQPWPTGPKTAQLVDELRARGGRVIAWTDDDIRRLMALAQLRSERSPHLHEWIVECNPAAEIDFLTEVLAPGLDKAIATDTEAPEVERPQGGPSHEEKHGTHAADSHTPTESTIPDDPNLPTESRTSGPQRALDVLPIGVRTASGEPVAAPLESFRKHIAIFAGSGSGKTVLIRRIVEEAALHGVSSIVLDINNDLARLGTPWPDGTREWAPGEHSLADRYFADTEVVVFTPGRRSGRPLSFRPLPEFASLESDTDEFTAAVDSAVGALLPKARPTERGARATRYEAVLRQAMVYFGQRGGGTLQSFVTLLSELPDGVSTLADAPRLAIDLAENLKASMANDPLLDEDAAPADPGLLLTPSSGYRARVSVINLAGLGNESRVANFVGQLQMSLFAWIKKHPAADRPLGGLLVMDEAQNYAPSQGVTTATQSTLALASQARKYGLGLLFATQAPKGIHGRLSGNASTQFFGKLNHPTQIEAAKDLANSKGSPIPDVGRLSTGTFYTAVDGGRFVKVDTPLCLSYHPKSPPTEDEVVEIARTPRA